MPHVGALRAGIARSSRRGDHKRADELRAEYYTEILAEKIKATVDKAPEMSAEQVERLRALLPVPAAEQAGGAA